MVLGRAVVAADRVDDSEPDEALRPMVGAIRRDVIEAGAFWKVRARSLVVGVTRCRDMVCVVWVRRERVL